MPTLNPFLSVSRSGLLAAWLFAGSLSGSGAQEPARSARETAAEPLYRAAVEFALVDAARGAGSEPGAVLERIEAALRAGACPTRTLTESAFGRLHTQARFRELIRGHARQATTVMVLPEEPGERLAFSGTVRDAAGSPVAGVLVYAFQTDARGIYSAAGEGAPRLFGYARTDADGRYGFRTIRPGPYPDETEPVEAHVHLEFTPPGGTPIQARLGFADDPHWQSPHWQGRPVPAWARPVVRAADGQHCTLDLTLPSQPDPPR